MAEEEKEQKVKDRITELLEKKYTRSQLINDFDFATSTVDTVIREYKESHDGEIPAQQAPKEDKFEVIKMDTKQIVPPEQALRGIRLQDGEYKLGFQDGMGVLIMAARYNQILAATQSEILTNQIKIMEESRKGSAEMAQEAAMRAAAGVGAQIMPEVEAIKTQIMSQGQNPMASMMMTLMMPSMQQAAQSLARLFGGTQAGTTGQPQQGGEQPGSPPNVEEHDISEWEG